MSKGRRVDFGNTAEDVPSGALRIITVERFQALEAALREREFGSEINHVQHRAAPTDARAFALEVVYVIVNSGMKVSVAGPIYAAREAALDAGISASAVFGHAGKAAAIDAVWRDREPLFVEFGDTADVLAFASGCRSSGRLPNSTWPRTWAATSSNRTSTWRGWRRQRASPRGSFATDWPQRSGTEKRLSILCFGERAPKG